MNCAGRGRGQAACLSPNDLETWEKSQELLGPQFLGLWNKVGSSSLWYREMVEREAKEDKRPRKTTHGGKSKVSQGRHVREHSSHGSGRKQPTQKLTRVACVARAEVKDTS